MLRLQLGHAPDKHNHHKHPPVPSYVGSQTLGQRLEADEVRMEQKAGRTFVG